MTIKRTRLSSQLSNPALCYASYRAARSFLNNRRLSDSNTEAGAPLKPSVGLSGVERNCHPDRRSPLSCLYLPAVFRWKEDADLAAFRSQRPRCHSKASDEERGEDVKGVNADRSAGNYLRAETRRFAFGPLIASMGIGAYGSNWPTAHNPPSSRNLSSRRYNNRSGLSSK